MHASVHTCVHMCIYGAKMRRHPCSKGPGNATLVIITNTVISGLHARWHIQDHRSQQQLFGQASIHPVSNTVMRSYLITSYDPTATEGRLTSNPVALHRNILCLSGSYQNLFSRPFLLASGCLFQLQLMHYTSCRQGNYPPPQAPLSW